MKNIAKICILVFALSLLLANYSLASDTPQLPAQYYGKVISPTPLSGYIEVKIGDKSYNSIPLVNNTFGGPTYLDEKLLVYAPGQDGSEVTFYLNGSTLLNTSADTIYYNAGDVRYTKLYYNIDIKKLEILNERNITLDDNVIDSIDINNISTDNESGLNLVKIPVKFKDIKDTIVIPEVNGSAPVGITSEILDNINKTLHVAEELKNQEMRDASDVNDMVERIKNNITPIFTSNFNITDFNITNMSTISFKAVNTSKKGFAIVRIPIGNMNVKNITIDTGTNITALKENDFGNKIGWYRMPTDGVLEITVIKDPIINVTLSAELPDGNTDDDTSPGGGRPSTSKDPYPDVSSGIKSEKIREIVHKAKLIIGSEIDGDLSAKDLKTTLDLTDKSLEIKEDCILIGGPVANPTVKKYFWTFPVKITNEYPGKHRGVIQKQIINGHTVILLAGSDRWGTKAAVEYFKTLEDIPDEPIFVEWRDGKAFKINKP